MLILVFRSVCRQAQLLNVALIILDCLFSFLYVITLWGSTTSSTQIKNMGVPFSSKEEKRATMNGRQGLGTTGVLDSMGSQVVQTQEGVYIEDKDLDLTP